MKKVLISIIFIFLVGLFATQVVRVFAGEGHKPVTSPVTSPVTGSTFCKFGWGWGDKNHCHIGPKGHDNDEHNNNEDHSHDNDGHNNNNNGKNDNDHHSNNGHH